MVRRRDEFHPRCHASHGHDLYAINRCPFYQLLSRIGGRAGSTHPLSQTYMETGISIGLNDRDRFWVSRHHKHWASLVVRLRRSNRFRSSPSCVAWGSRRHFCSSGLNVLGKRNHRLEALSSATCSYRLFTTHGW